MNSASFNICFDFQVDAARSVIQLEADVTEHHSETYYVVTNFRIPGRPVRQILPAITIRKEKGVWVHIDSGNQTALSRAVGAAIEEVLKSF